MILVICPSSVQIPSLRAGSGSSAPGDRWLEALLRGKTQIQSDSAFFGLGPTLVQPWSNLGHASSTATGAKLWSRWTWSQASPAAVSSAPLFSTGNVRCWRFKYLFLPWHGLLSQFEVMAGKRARAKRKVCSKNKGAFSGRTGKIQTEETPEFSSLFFQTFVF